MRERGMRQSPITELRQREAWLCLLALAALVLIVSPGCGLFGGSGAANPAAKSTANKDAGGDQSSDDENISGDDDAADEAGLLKEPEEESDAAKEDPEKKLPPFEIGRMSVLPQPPVTIEEQKQEENQVIISPAKAGHWSSGTREMVAHDADYAGRLTSYVSAGGSRPKFLPNSRYALRSSRPAALPKGRSRLLTIDFLLPHSDERQYAATVSSELASAAAGMQDGFALLREHEQFFVVLASDAEGHSFWRTCDSARPWHGDVGAFAGEQDIFEDPDSLEAQAGVKLRELEGKRDTHYRVEIAQVVAEHSPPLPSTPLAWTTIAYVVWDDVDPELLTQEQRQAMVDWLHWGGQIVLGGPNSLESLRGSFLDPYLPAAAGKATELTAGLLAPLNEQFSDQFTFLEGVRRGQAMPPLSRVQPAEPVSASVLEPAKDARVVLRDAEGGPLVVERPCGRGRIVVTAFRLTEPAINRDWRHFDNFANACLLRRPPRLYVDTGLAPRVDWAYAPGRRFDGAVLSQLRYFSRDAETWDRFGEQASRFLRYDSAIRGELRVFPEKGNIAWEDFVRSYRNPSELPDDRIRDPRQWAPGAGGGAWTGSGFASYSGEEPRRGYGVWDDNSAVPAAARDTLLESTGIEIPSAQFVLWVLAGYLFFLVPVNYLFFRVLNRLEWAWISVPLMAIGAAAIVIKLAQLEIGFVRSAEEIAVCELQAGYSRAHVSRFMTLYTSLGTNFSVGFDDSGACAAPFAPDASYVPDLGATPIVADFTRDGRKTELAGVRILSNDADMVRAEHMLDLEGAVELESFSNSNLAVLNGTQLKMTDCGAFRVVDWGTSDDPPTIEACWFGDLAPGARASGRLMRKELQRRGEPLFPEWRRSISAEDELDLSRLIDLAVDDHTLPLGAVRMVGRIPERLPGVTISPDPAQKSGETLVVVNLHFPRPEPPTSDLNHLGAAMESYQQRLNSPFQTFPE